ncbi:MAG: hypothetical protein MZV65_33160 [Chromatiales bacterium]|nr:hypothetical protein [Chromatiales bacterium]
MPEGTVDWGTLRQDFIEGKTAMMWHTTGNLTAVRDSAKFDFGVSHAAGLASSAARPPAAATSTSSRRPRRRSARRRSKFVKFMTAPELRRATGASATGYVAIRARRLRDADAQEIRRRVPAGGRRARPVPVRRGRAVHVHENARVQQAPRRRHPERRSPAPKPPEEALKASAASGEAR